MKKLILYILLILGIVACNPDAEIIDPPIDTPDFEGYTLEWSDEFNDNAISTLNWTYELGNGTDYGLPPGWGNNELQFYTDANENSFIEMDGDDVSALVIAATEESPGEYRSAKLTTQGLRSFRYGKIDARIKLPTAQGMWPAFWMLGENITEVDWPGCGEIDIFELVGLEPNVVHGNVHYTNADKKYTNDEGSPKMINETFDQNYHNFGIDWTPTEITFSLDGQVYKTTLLGEDMKEFQRSFYLILNVAVGGSWPGSPDASTTFPQRMYVDYIRYYSKDGFSAPEPPELNIDDETVGVIIPPSISRHVFNSMLNQFPNAEIKVYGAGGEPLISTSDIVVDGDSSLLFSYPGGNWGGGWFQVDEPLDLSAHASGNLVFSIQHSGTLNDAEIKLEAFSNSAAVFLINYTPTEVENGFVEYTIPIADFIDLNLTDMKIPFALWNPVDASGDFSPVDILVDNVYWTE